MYQQKISPYHRCPYQQYFPTKTGFHAEFTAKSPLARPLFSVPELDYKQKLGAYNL